MPPDAQALIPPLLLQEEIGQAVQDALEASDLQRIVVARADGIVLAHNLPRADQAKRLAAMGAAVVGIAAMASSETEQGSFHEASIAADRGRLVCMQAGAEAIVAGLFPAGANVGLVLIMLRRLADRIAEAIERAESGR